MRILLTLLLSVTGPALALHAQGLTVDPRAGHTANGRDYEAQDMPPPVLIKIGDGINSSGKFNGTDQTPFIQALAALPAGGTILVGAGVYTFGMPVQVSAPHVTISGTGAQLMSSDDVDVGLFDVRADHFTLMGLQLSDEAPARDHALVRMTGSQARIRDCTFVGGDAASFEPHFIRLEGQESHNLIEENTFIPNRGWTGIHATGSAALNIIRNSFSGIGTGGPLRMKYAIWAYNTSFGEIKGNKFLSLGSPDELSDAVIYSENATTDSHHWTIANNTFHMLNCRRVMELRGSSFNLIEGNSIGRILDPSLVAVIDISSNSAGYAATATSITNNEFHNFSAPAIKINDGAGFLISSNLFTIMNSTAIEIGSEGPTDYTSIASNQFRASGQIGSQPAINVLSGVGHAIHSNSIYGFATPGVSISPLINPADYSRQGNYYRD